jgi:hypothetical protein
MPVMRGGNDQVSRLCNRERPKQIVELGNSDAIALRGQLLIEHLVGALELGCLRIDGDDL